MENEFDYMNQPENTEQSVPASQPQEMPAPGPSAYYGSPYDYSDIPTPTPEPVPEPAPEPVPVTPVPEKPQRKKSGKGLVIAISIVAAVMLLFNVVMLAANAWQQERNDALTDKISALEKRLDKIGTQSGTAVVPSNPGQAPTPEGLLTPQQVYAMNVDAVVAVTSEGLTTNSYGQISKTASSGSGFIISADGYVVTNYHVIEGARQVSIITSDETVHEAAIVGHDETNDVALLKIEGSNFAHVTIGSSDALNVGDQVMAIGNPLGELTSTLTVGYVSAKDRMVTTDGTSINMLQTDAAINSGNSGGPLFNAMGQVVGINTAKYSGTSSSGATIEGIGFAIPIDDVVGIIDDLMNNGYVSTTYLGVMVREVDASAQSYGLPAGVYVESVTPGFCAEEAGVRAKDIIVGLGEYKVDSMSALSRALRRFEAGDTTTITVYRSGQNVTLDITLDEKPMEEVPAEQEQQATEPAEGGFSYPGDIWDYFFPGG